MYVKHYESEKTGSKSKVIRTTKKCYYLFFDEKCPEDMIQKVRGALIGNQSTMTDVDEIVIGGMVYLKAGKGELIIKVEDVFE